MTRVAWRTALADLRASWQQALLIGVILLAACATLMLSLTLLRSAEAPWDRAFDKANGAHVTFSIWTESEGRNAAEMPDLTTLSTAPGVAAASDLIPGLSDVPLVTNGTRHTLSLQAPSNLPLMNQPLITDGTWLSGTSGEIVLNRSVARSANIAVGDTITLSSGGTPLTLQVVGFAVSPWREIYPANSGLSWLTPDDLRALEPDPSRWDQTLGVRLDDPTDSMGVMRAARALLADPATDSGVRFDSDDWRDTRADVTEWNRINAGFLGMFSLVALVAAALVTANVVAARVLAQARQIGLLKAVGVTPAGVVAIFLVQHLIIAVVAAIGGVAVGLAFAPLLLRRLADALQTTAAPVWNAEIVLLAGVIVASALVVVTLATVIPALRAGRVSVVRAITAGTGAGAGAAGATVTSRRGGGSRMARLAARLRLPLVVQLGLKDTFSRPWRALLTVCALTISLITIIFALGAQATFDRTMDQPALQGEPFDLEVRRRDLPPDEALALLQANPDVQSVYPRAMTQAQITRLPRTQFGETSVPPTSFPGLLPTTYSVRAVAGDLQAAGFLIAGERGRLPLQAGEAVAGWGLYEALDLQTGDTLRVIAEGRTLEVTLVGQYLEDDDDGEVLMLSMETVQQVLPGVQPTDYLVHLLPGAFDEGVAVSLLQASDYRLDVWTRTDEATGDADTASIQGVVTGLGLTLAFVGLINLIATTVISVRERNREYAILRAIGLTPGQITLVVGSSVATLAAIAGVLGLPLGLLVSRLVYYGVLQRYLGLVPEWFTFPAWWQLALMVPALVVAALAAAALPAQRATRIDIAQALRAD